MAIHYLVTERLIPVYIGEEGIYTLHQGSFKERRSFFLDQGISLPKNYRIANLDSKTKTSIHVIFFNINYGHFLIKTPNQNTAYAALRALDAFFFLATGDEPDLHRLTPRLLELDHVPRAEWTNGDLHRELNRRNRIPDSTILSNLYSGRYVQQYEMRLLGPYVEAIYSDRSLAEALNHLGHSRFLFNGYMVGSYYECHYKHERMSTPQHDMQKRYFENRERYELAFVSAFKGIERFLHLNQIKKNNIERALIQLASQEIQPSTIYKRWHEVFSGYSKEIAYKNLILHFLNIRNGVAAHANPSPPEQFWISEDNLIEIQYFLKELCYKKLEFVQPRQLPKQAILSLMRKDDR